MRAALAFLLAFLAPAAAFATPSEIAAEYRLTTAGLTIGHVTETFERSGDRYAIRSVARSEGALKIFFDDALRMESSGKVVPSGLQPLAFTQRRESSEKSEVHATFDWERGVMRSTVGEKTSDVPLPRETQDRISVMYQFMNLQPGSETVSMHMSNGRKVELYTYRLVDAPHITTPAGGFDTLHYQRVTEGTKENRVDVWLAKDRFNFPVRVVFDDPKGLRVEQLLVTLRSR